MALKPFVHGKLLRSDMWQRPNSVLHYEVMLFTIFCELFHLIDGNAAAIDKECKNWTAISRFLPPPPNLTEH